MGEVGLDEGVGGCGGDLRGGCESCECIVVLSLLCYSVKNILTTRHAIKSLHYLLPSSQKPPASIAFPIHFKVSSRRHTEPPNMKALELLRARPQLADSMLPSSRTELMKVLSTFLVGHIRRRVAVGLAADLDESPADERFAEGARPRVLRGHYDVVRVRGAEDVDCFVCVRGALLAARCV